MKRFAPIALTLLLCLLPTTAMAQGLGGDLFEGIEGFEDLGGGGQSDPNLKITADYVVDPSGTHGRIDIKATVGSDWCLYSTTQPKGGPMATKLKVEDNPGITAVGTFTPDRKPKIVPPDKIIRVAQEKFYEKVTWSAPILLAPGTNPADLQLKVTLNGQSCHDKGTCFPVSANTVAKFAGEKDVPKPDLLPQKAANPSAAVPPTDYKIKGSMGDYKTEGGHGVLSGKFEPATVEPGDEVTVTLNFKPTGDYHIYAYSPTDSTIGYKSTQIALGEETPWLAGQAKTQNPIVKKALIDGFPPVLYHKGETTWKFTVQVPIDAVPGKYPLVGYIGYQTCTDTTCDRPSAAMFEGVVQVGEKEKDESVPFAFSAAKYSKAAERAKITHAEVQDAKGDGANIMMAPPTPDEPEENVAVAPPAPLGNEIKWMVRNPPEAASLGWIIVLSFIGGAILNLMPCVLPVVGLKILSFVNQAGKHRAQVFMLNLIYSLGVIFVFMVLAVVSSSLNLIVGSMGAAEGAAAGGADGLAWGQWSGDWRYILAMIILVYTMGLSMLGVWELTMPSFLGSGGVANASNKSGYGGAFFKGIVTTLLSTPCSGPFLGPVFGYTISQDTYVTFIVFGSIGLGMASPYLIIGMNPRLIAFLPKPGNWMVAFKQLMGFVMMLTVVYLMYTMPDEYVVPTLTLLVGLGAGCWMLGQVHTLEHKSSKIATTIGAFVVAIGIGFFSYTNLIESDAHEGSIAWDTYAEERWPALENDIYARQQAGETVMVDFTADWCPTCKVNYYTAINTDGVGEVVNEHGIVPMLVDWTNTTHDNSPQVQKFINKLGSNSIPLLAIFPGGKAGEAYVLSDLLSESKVIEFLNAAQQEAGSAPKQTAMQE